MTDISIIRTPITREEVRKVAEQTFGDFAKAVVDVEKKIMAIGGELHADAEALLLQNGSARKDLWGINLYPARMGADWLQCDSMINIRPAQGNHSRRVEDVVTQEKIRQVVGKLVAS